MEKFNRTLLSTVRTLDKEKKADWIAYLNEVIHAYYCTRSEATGYSPFNLLFGRTPLSPIDLIFGLQAENEGKSYHEYELNWQKQIKEAFAIAGDMSCEISSCCGQHLFQWGRNVRPASC